MWAGFRGEPVLWVSNHVQHKPGRTNTEDVQRLELWDFKRRILHYLYLLEMTNILVRLS